MNKSTHHPTSPRQGTLDFLQRLARVYQPEKNISIEAAKIIASIATIEQSTC